MSHRPATRPTALVAPSRSLSIDPAAAQAAMAPIATAFRNFGQALAEGVQSVLDATVPVVLEFGSAGAEACGNQPMATRWALASGTTAARGIYRSSIRELRAECDEARRVTMLRFKARLYVHSEEEALDLAALALKHAGPQGPANAAAILAGYRDNLA